MHFQVRYSVPLLLCAASLLSACGGGGGGGGGDSGSTPTPTPTPESLGLMRIVVSGIGTSGLVSRAELISAGTAAGSPQPRAVTDVPLGIDVKQISATSVDVGTGGAGGMRYFNVIYSVRNAQFCATPGTCPAYGIARQNLTMIGARTSSNIDDTALDGLKREDGTVEPIDIALDVLPAHGAMLNGPGTGVLVQAGYESLQVFSEAEIAAIVPDTGATGLLPFGYVAKNVNTPGSRLLPANPAANQFDGQIAFSFKVPLQASSLDDPFSVSLIFQVVDDANTRVTQSVEEQTLAGDAVATARAVALGSTDLVVLGGRVAATDIGDPVCVVRTAGPPGAPTATLVNNGNAPTLASTPYNLQFLDIDTSIDAGFCMPMSVGDFSTMVVSGSQSGTRTALGTYTGTYGGSGTNRLSFSPDAGHPYFIGEQVSYTYTTGLKSSSGNATVAQAFVGSFLVRGSVASSGTFSAATNVTIGDPATSNPSAIAVGDFNGDGKLDLAVADYTADNVAILLNDGSGGYAAKHPIFSVGCSVPPCGPLAVVAADFNGDGALDLATTNQNGNNVSILFGNGSGSFGAPVSVIVGSNPEALAVGDFNGDGKPDLAVLNTGDGTVSILINNGSGGFTVAGTLITGGSPFAIAVGDFNGDGRLDLVTANGGDSDESIFLGNGSGGFAAPTLIFVGSSPDSVAVADFNNDGIPDLAISSSGDGTVAVATGKGDGTFNPASSFSVGSGAASNPYAVIAGDFNGDGRLDIATANNADGTVSILLHNSGSGFDAATNVSVGNNPYSVVPGDFNNDGRLDLAAPNFVDGSISILSGQP